MNTPIIGLAGAIAPENCDCGVCKGPLAKDVAEPAPSTPRLDALRSALAPMDDFVMVGRTELEHLQRTESLALQVVNLPVFQALTRLIESLAERSRGTP